MLDRFIEIQDRNNNYLLALNEMRNGHKSSHWIWYVFPQLKGLGSSYYANYYGIKDLEEAREYLNNPTLRERLYQICEAVLNQPQNDVEILMGSAIDSIKLRSSMTLFDMVEPNSIFDKILTRFFDGGRCKRTLRMLQD